MKPVGFQFEGKPVSVLPGDTVAVALARAGIAAQRITRHGEWRGTFCGIGLCHDCLVEVDGRRAQRACMTGAEGVRTVRRHGEDAPSALNPLAPRPERDALDRRAVDLAIVGAGPAGLAAALKASNHGLRVVVIDERTRAGGQYLKPRIHAASGARKDRQHQVGDRLRARLSETDAEHLSGRTVWFASRTAEGVELGLYGAGEAMVLATRAVILATGAYERPPLVPGWTLPGVMTIGAAQSFVRSYGVAPGQRILIAGNGPLGLQLACELIRAGTPPLAVVERARSSDPRGVLSLAAAARYAPGLVLKGVAMRATLRRAGVRSLEGWQLTGCRGDERVETASVAPMRGRGDETTFAVDTVCVGEGFLPQTELARALGYACRQDPDSGFMIPDRDGEGASSVPGVWIAGDGGGMGGAQAALAEGEIAAAAALAWLGTDTPPPRRAKATLARARRFQRALWSLYAAEARGKPQDETLLCRCESVRFGVVRQAIAQGATDLGALKRQTRLGMGRCQGRYCGGPAARLLDETQLFAPQVPARPVPAAALAIEKPEWGGHRQARTPHPRAPDRPCDDRQPLPHRADLAIIGAGVMGVAAALRASELGLDTVVVDRGGINGEASGGNAGSLHLQLLSFDFGSKAGARSDALLQTLPLQRDAIALWQELERDLGVSFEIALSGGLMLAEDDTHAGFLRQKVAAERRMGIEVELVGRDDIERLAPAVSERMTVGAWCPGEGKINPLVATPALARAARQRGVRFVEHVQVTGIARESDGYRLRTGAGSLTARRLILAAGGWTGTLGAMLGAPLPVHGAPLQMIVTETAPSLAPCLLAHANRHLTMKQAAAGNLIIGGAWSAGTAADTGRSYILRESLEGNLWVAERVLPPVAGLHILRSWAAMNVDIDGAPIIGPLEGQPDAVVVAGANGYTLGPLLGRLAAETVAGRALPAAYARFSPARFAETRQAGPLST